MKPLLILALALLTGCAHTDFYRNGQRLAHFEGDMTGMSLRIGADGSVEWSGNVNHSAATLAQGKAASDKLMALGAAVAASGVVAAVK